MTRLVLVRHAQSAWNLERRIQGQSGTGLSDIGRDQAECVARWLEGSHAGASLVSSDLQRCRETTAPIAAALGATATFDERLRERDFGDWAGRLLTEIERDDPARWDRWRGGEDVVAEVGGESSAELADRVVAAYTELADTGAETVVVVTHGGPVWQGTHAFLDLPPGRLGGVANTAVTELVAEPSGERWLDVWNQTAHLPTELVTHLRPADARASERRAAPAVGG